MQTSKDIYDQEMKAIKGNMNQEEFTQNQAGEDDLDAEDASFDDADNTAEDHEPVMQEQRGLKQKELQVASNLERFNTLRKASYLTKEESLKLKDFLVRYEKVPIGNEVLRHLVEQKVKMSGRYLQAEAKARDLYNKLLTEISKLTEESVKTFGVLEHTDKEILALVAANPEWLPENSKPPPS